MPDVSKDTRELTKLYQRALAVRDTEVRRLLADAVARVASTQNALDAQPPKVGSRDAKLLDRLATRALAQTDKVKREVAEAIEGGGKDEELAHDIAARALAAEATAAEAIAAEAVAAEPMAAEPFAAEPMAAEPMAAEPMAAEPVAAQPMAAPTLRTDATFVKGPGK